jgi:hypothetical protein
VAWNRSLDRKKTCRGTVIAKCPPQVLRRSATQEDRTLCVPCRPRFDLWNLLRILEVAISILGSEIDCTEVSHGFPSSLHVIRLIIFKRHMFLLHFSQFIHPSLSVSNYFLPFGSYLNICFRPTLIKGTIQD